MMVGLLIGRSLPPRAVPSLQQPCQLARQKQSAKFSLSTTHQETTGMKREKWGGEFDAGTSCFSLYLYHFRLSNLSYLHS